MKGHAPSLLPVVRANVRGRGIGRALMEVIARHARLWGIAQLEWQTPVWNTSAIAFYERLGGSGADKVRFTWNLHAI